MSDPAVSQDTPHHRPWGLRWRSSVWFVTAVVGVGMMTDLLVYSVVLPVFPFRLEGLGYKHVSDLTGWLLFAFSGGVVVSTPPIALLSERYQNRKVPLLLGMLALIGSQVMLMEAPSYSILVIGRVIQGIASSVIWILGLALLCDTAPEQSVGRQLGLAMSGVSLGRVPCHMQLLVGPPAGGALYSRFGIRGPFVFGIAITFVDLVGRLLIIERKDALVWGIDTMAMSENTEEDVEKVGEGTEEGERPSTQAEKVTASNTVDDTKVQGGSCEINAVHAGSVEITTTGESQSNNVAPAPQPAETRSQAATSEHKSVHLSTAGVLVKLAQSPRAVTVMVNTVIYGMAYSAQEPVLPLHMQATWGYNSSQVGLVMIACVVPTVFSSPLSGWYADRHGTEWITFWCDVLSIPFWVIQIIPVLPLFITSLAVQSFFTSGVVSPLTAELASISRNIDGVGYAHVYGAFNLCFGLGSAFGPLLGGQVYDHVKHGWMAVCLIATGCVAVSTVLAVLYTGEDTIRAKLRRRLATFRVESSSSDPTIVQPYCQ
ncbi:MFS general substrate transporter [Punctularia strigosozonata HHB-11173 SS5]|uniref:MFS general substrate transporter n=1 Tax=Punctularia strigosozonata (strain HHB-11173) TaxID=741275 RepID=UPI00044184AC|nr:MFS general substrate transporter [Punctularia strigosozonata HHB-11173 SS5]EIN13364.1 MFS general substrate transporter [Punctularia strigosozonata HHB-11173 SS5]